MHCVCELQFPRLDLILHQLPYSPLPSALYAPIPARVGAARRSLGMVRKVWVPKFLRDPPERHHTAYKLRESLLLPNKHYSNIRGVAVRQWGGGLKEERSFDSGETCTAQGD